MRIGYVTLSGRGLIDDCLCDVVAALREDGWHLAGTVRVFDDAPDGHPCDMDIEVLPKGPRFRISQALGTGARGCRLDGGAIEAIAVEVEARIADADILIINKFGKQESMGRGLCGAIAAALERRIPVLVGVNGLNLPDFLAFTDKGATRLPADPNTILAWVAAQKPAVDLVL